MPSNSAIDWPALLGRGLLCIALAGGIQAAMNSTAQAADPLLPAPYQVEGIMRETSDRYAEDQGQRLGPPMITVSLGTAEGRPPPAREGLEKMTIMGAGSSVVGQLYDIYKHCDFLCGDELEECHYRARFALPAEGPKLERPLAAVPAALPLTSYQNLQGAEWTDFFTLSTIWTEKGFSPEAWRPSQKNPTSHSLKNWDDGSKTMTYTTRFPDGGEFKIEGGSCKLRTSGDLNEVGCNGMSLLFAEGAPRLVSYPDYNIATAQAVASFEQGGLTYYLVLLGLKAQNVFGLLVKTETGWVARFQPRDYALLC